MRKLLNFIFKRIKTGTSWCIKATLQLHTPKIINNNNNESNENDNQSNDNIVNTFETISETFIF